eukprot:Tamp_04207.p2 GENE.Tamp_04207~~Tamp_04207.p2  ORF type:complete len:368 (-),score=131.92 Tamp_04207:2278-3360(-)
MESDMDETQRQTAIKYLRFAAIQRNVQIKDLETEINDFKESRIPDDDTYSSDDVRELIDSLQTSIRADTYRNLQRVAHSTVVLLRQCLQQAAQHGVTISVDTGLLQDEKFLLEAKRIEEESERTPEPTKQLAPTASGVGKLMKLPGLENAKTAEALGSENAILKQKLADLQRELVDVNREKTLFGDRLRAAETAMTDAGVPVPVHETGPDTVVASPSATATGSSSLAPLAPLGSGGGASVRAGGLAPVGGGGGGNAAVCAKCGGGVSDGAVSSAAAGVEAGSGGGAAEVAELQGKLKAAEAELHAKQAETAALQEQMEMRINQTPQFKSLNQMMQKKNEEIKVMRETLKGYGWKDPAENA